MAEKKQHKIVSASTGEEVKAGEKVAPKAAPKAAPQAAPASAGGTNPKTLRIVAWIFWIFAIVAEVFAVLIYAGKIDVTFISTLAAVLIILAIDLVLVITGAQFWKRANHMDPVSEANKVKFWLWNNMGVIVCCFAFIPFIIVALTNKDADPKLKKWAIIAAVAALLIGGLLGYDWNPVSQEGLAQATQTLSDTTVYWTPFGTKYHTHEDCQYLNRSDTLTAGTIDQAIEAGRSTICSACAKKDNLVVGENGAVSVDAQQVVENIAEVASEALEPAA